MNKSFWKNKKVFITGHTGFKGSWLSLWLLDLGAIVKGYALSPETDPSLFQTLKIEKDLQSVYGDIRDFEKLKKEIHDFNPDIIFHLAAQPLVRRSYRDPIETYSTNVMGTVHVLEAAKNLSSLSQIINVTTDKVYENLERGVPFKESDRLGGLDPYSNSKSCSELVTTSYRHSFYLDSNVKIVTARAGNVIGGGDWSEDRLIPDLIRAYVSKEKLIIRNPSSIRPWQHVLESVEGYLKLSEYLDSANQFETSWNFGPGGQDFLSVQEIVSFIQTEFPQMKIDVDTKASSEHEAQILKLDNSLSTAKLNWRPTWEARVAIQKTISWYLDFYHSHAAQDLCRQQIREFTQ